MSSKEEFEIDDYLKSTKNVCICTVLSMFLIIIFILTPLNNIFFASLISKIIIIGILAYTLYINFNSTRKLNKDINIFSGPMNNIKTNIICSHVFSLFILILLLTVIRQFF